MSKHFYDYLAGRIYDFFNRINIKPGEKYHIQFERTEQVQDLVNQVRKLDHIEPFYMDTEDGDYQSFCIVCPTAKVLIASNIEEVTPDF
ncbi:hypothetical protein HMSSN036_74630 [Paenibacillus macerans]|nr:hypothetical protein HMSSN036_74630 [Paenibacillus macerans]